jgi:hypothetical protein
VIVEHRRFCELVALYRTRYLRLGTTDILRCSSDVTADSVGEGKIGDSLPLRAVWCRTSISLLSSQAAAACLLSRFRFAVNNAVTPLYEQPSHMGSRAVLRLRATAVPIT